VAWLRHGKEARCAFPPVGRKPIIGSAGTWSCLDNSINQEIIMKKITIAIVLMLALMLSTVGIAGAITDGVLMAMAIRWWSLS